MIDPDSPVVFPNNVVLVLADKAKLIDPPETEVFRRALRPSDPRQCIGIFASQWIPNEDSFEMGGGTLGGYRQETTLQQYLISIQAMVLDMDEVRGLTKHSILAKMTRDMLLRDPSVGVALAALSVTDAYGLIERTKRRWVRTQRYVSNEISGEWVYLATIEFLIETETA